MAFKLGSFSEMNWKFLVEEKPGTDRTFLKERMFIGSVFHLVPKNFSSIQPKTLLTSSDDLKEKHEMGWKGNDWMKKNCFCTIFQHVQKFWINSVLIQLKTLERTIGNLWFLEKLAKSSQNIDILWKKVDELMLFHFPFCFNVLTIIFFTILKKCYKIWSFTPLIQVFVSSLQKFRTSFNPEPSLKPQSTTAL